MSIPRHTQVPNKTDDEKKIKGSELHLGAHSS